MATGTYQVGQDNHDGEEAGGTITITSGNVRINASDRYGLCIFDVSADVNPGATISAATCDLYFTSGTVDDVNDSDIDCENVDTPAVLTTTTNNISNRTQTGSPVNWTGSSLGTGWITTPDISGPVQTVVNRSGWTGLIAVIFNPSATSNYRFSDYSADSALAAKLNLTYTNPVGGGAPLQAHYARMRGN